jgi:ABC transport system ATP-binding/permease protein
MSNNVAPVILSALELEVHYGEQIVLDKASLSVHEGDRIGLVGRNGAGKSTFLKIISGLMPPDAGEVARKKDLVIGFLSQEFTLDESKNIYNNILTGASDELEIINEYDETPFDSPRKYILEEKILRMDSWNLEKRINVLVRSLNAPDITREISSLSGGEKRRVALCRALISNPDLLILDEPTNHLDTKSIEWLEDFLAGYRGTCIFVTHDRYFLDRIANRIVELSSGVFYSHQGNYTEYLINKTERQAVKEVEERKRQLFLKRELEWVRRGPRARRTKSKSRLDNFYKISDESNVELDIEVDLIIPPAERLGKKVVELIDAGIKLGNKILFDKFTFNFEAGKKIGVVGDNGAGKTTLLKIILGEIDLTSGKIERGETTIINYVDQSRLILNDNDTVVNAIGEGNEVIRFGRFQLNVWTYLKRFLFTDDRINTEVGKLSGGEKSRLTLAKILSRGGNFLLLDEPTNDLDLPTLRILEEALISFKGSVVVVSHDRYFLNRICNGIIAFEEKNEIYYSEGNYDYYIQKRKHRLEELKPEKKESTAEHRSKSKINNIKRLTYNETRELEQIEEKIITAESEVERIEKIFTSADFYSNYASQTNELKQQLDEAKDKVKLLYERWDELERKREQI